MSTPMRIPLDTNAPWYSFNITLSQVRYRIGVRFNVHMGRWIMGIADAAGNPIVAGVPLLIGRDLLAAYPTLALPPGPFAVADLSGSGNQPGLASFLQDHVLAYLDPTQ